MQQELTAESILDMIHSIHPISPALRQDLRSRMKEERFAKGQYLLKAGDICYSMYFIAKGLIHCYAGSKEKPDTDYFMTEGEIAMSKESFYNQKISEQHIEAMEKTVSISISYADLEALYTKYVEFNINGRKLTEIYHQRSNFKVAILRIKGSVERYNFLKDHRPDFIERLPGKYLSSFLGIREETFCRIKTKVKKKRAYSRRKKKRHS